MEKKKSFRNLLRTKPTKIWRKMIDKLIIKIAMFRAKRIVKKGVKKGYLKMKGDTVFLTKKGNKFADEEFGKPVE